MTADMKTWTVDDILAEHPCSTYTRERVTALWAGREALTLCEILALDIPPEDRLWVAHRPSALSPDVRQRWIHMVADRCVADYALHCGVPAVEAWATRWLDGTDRSRAAACAAADATRSAARCAAGCAAEAWVATSAVAAAVAATAMAAAWDAAAASRAVATAAEAEAAEAAAYMRQIADLMAVLDAEEQR